MTSLAAAHDVIQPGHAVAHVVVRCAQQGPESIRHAAGRFPAVWERDEIIYGHRSMVTIVHESPSSLNLASDTARTLALGCEFDPLHGSGFVQEVERADTDHRSGGTGRGWRASEDEDHRGHARGGDGDEKVRAHGSVLLATATERRLPTGRGNAGEHGCDGMISGACSRVGRLGGHGGEVHGLPEIAGLLFGEIGCAHARRNHAAARRIPGRPN
jgi:hypothetical protein